MNTEDRNAYLEHLQECVNIASRNGYSPDQVATDILLLSAPPVAETETYVKLNF